jgi:hypothetical protein
LLLPFALVSDAFLKRTRLRSPELHAFLERIDGRLELGFAGSCVRSLDA